jgi:hypothetical protein
MASWFSFWTVVKKTNPSGKTKSVRNGCDRAMFSERGWVNKLLKQEGTAYAVVGSGTRVLAATLNPNRISTSLYDYHSSRQVSCEALIPELYTGANTACSSLVLSTAASATKGQLERRTLSSFGDGFGNVTAISTEARNQATRTLSSNYGVSGYFPETVTDALGKNTTSGYGMALTESCSPNVGANAGQPVLDN